MRDIWLPATVVAVVAMMVLPLPGFLLDYAIMTNMAAGVTLLVAVVYLREPESFTSLPSLLLLATLLRLGLNVSTTRQILSTGVAPNMIEAFGEFMVQGNFIVGLTVFLIITLIQFIVIAKGAERVAEVAARFTLDALPGKQMSIDADLRSGIISVEQAKKRRQELQREARLYAALDGAMKFVKGDAIAGLVISAVNIIAGLLVGVIQLGLSVGEAAEAFLVYAVGDGLSSQIPALLVSVAAGIAVTRVADKDSALLSKDIFSQLTGEPKALAATSAVLFLFALFPGMPVLPFLSGSLVLGLLARSIMKGQKKEVKQEVTRTFNARPQADILVKLSGTALIEIQKSLAFVPNIHSLRERVFEERGVLVPEPDFDVITLGEAGVLFEIWIHGTRVKAVKDVQGKIEQEILNQLHECVDKKLTEFIDDTQTRVLLEFHSSACEDIINHLVPTKLPVTTLTQILRQLVTEKVSIKNLKVILQALCEYTETGTNDVFARPHTAGAESPRQALQIVRQALGKQIVQSIIGSEQQLNVAVVDPELDYRLGQAELEGKPLSPAVHRTVLTELAGLKDAQAVLCSSIARIVLWRIVRSAALELPVLAIEEVPQTIQMDQVALIKGDTNATIKAA